MFAACFRLAGATEQVNWARGVQELRAVLDESKTLPPSATQERPHTFLLLDRHLHNIPWESLPVLETQSVTRVPSLAYLRDRMVAAERERIPRGPDGTYILPSRKTCYVLNPSGDLARSETRFGPWLASQKSRGWAGAVGRAPLDLLSQLEESDLFLYFGHGGGEQYLGSPNMLRRLPRCAAAMLWGCSSGQLRDEGAFDPQGLPHDYLLAGCPALLACLWDTTDKELDHVAESVYLRLGLLHPSQQQHRDENSAYSHIGPSPLPPPPHASADARVRTGALGTASLPEAAAAARKDCRLPLMTGAAVVLYGLPIRFAP